MENIHILINFILNLLRDPALATFLTILGLITTMRPSKPTPSELEVRSSERSIDMSMLRPIRRTKLHSKKK